MNEHEPLKPLSAVNAAYCLIKAEHGKRDAERTEKEGKPAKQNAPDIPVGGVE